MLAPITSASRKPAFRCWFPLVLMVGLLATVYLLTLQRDINGSDHEYAIDVGEIQIALNLWGTIHHTGYPLYTILASALITLFRFIGANPATAASSTSMVFGLAAAIVFYHLLLARTGQSAIALIGGLALGLTQGMWLHSVIAEVYTFYVLTAGLAMWWVFKDEREWQTRDWLVAALLLGLAIGHHRATAFIIPALAVWLWPQIWRSGRQMPLILLAGTGIVLATFLVYLYLPLRTWAGAQWVTEPTADLRQFWRVATAEEADFLFVLPASRAEWLANLSYVIDGLAQQVTPVGLIAGIVAVVGLIVFAPTRRFGLALLIGIAAYLPFPVMFPKIVPVAGFLLPAVMLLLLALAESANRLSRILSISTSVRRLTPVAGLTLAGVLFVFNLPFVVGIVRDPSGREMISAVSNLPLEDFDSEPALMLGRGMLYYAVYYGLNVTREIDRINLVDHRADLGELASHGQPILTVPISFYVFLPDWWSARLGGFHLSSAGAGFVQVSGQPPLAGRNWPDEVVQTMDNGASLLAYEVEEYASRDSYHLALWWRADQSPLEEYSIYVHLACVENPDSPDDIILSADSASAVYGWYGTSLWSEGEVVREDYMLATPPEHCVPLFLRVGMYRQQADGGFQNFDAVTVQLE